MPRKGHAHHENLRTAEKLFRFLRKAYPKGQYNTFDITKGEETWISFPVTVLVLFLIFAFWVTIPLMIIGLFFGFRYRFGGPDLGNNPVNNAMDSAAAMAENIKNTINDDKKQ